jgi:hypothetical protein
MYVTNIIKIYERFSLKLNLRRWVGMNKLYYCSECKRVLSNGESCNYCNSNSVYELAVGAPCNVIGTKLKGKVLKIKDNTVRLLIRDEGNNKLIREYDGEKLRKVL